ncbi:MAG: hypothetical protein GC155_08595 [Alphaproteobacteria bacterium]|nr:hypothetical protein [Alphaproteobacteria bacterium]
MPPKTRLGVMTGAIFLAAGFGSGRASAAPPDDACPLLTVAQVGATVETPVSPGAYVTPTFKKTCTWTVSNPTDSGVKFVTLMIEEPGGFDGGKRVPKVKGVEVTPASGIGDDAYFLDVGDNVGLIVKKAGVGFKVAVYGGVPVETKKAMEKALAADVIARL